MPYNETTVIIGGLFHIPVIIVILKLVEKRFKTNDIELQGN